MNLKPFSIINAILAIGLMTGCDKPADSFSLLSAGQSFRQGSGENIQVKIDILWVVDNSYSMNPLQQNLVNNFNSFIGSFVTKGYDFHIGVTTSDAYRAAANFNNNSNLSLLRDGVGATHSGVRVITPTTSNIVNTFMTNSLQGDGGSGDERAFSSIRETLINAGNASFIRPGAFLAVIILSDEDDFSSDTRAEYTGTDHSYTASSLDPVSKYVTFLDNFTGSTDPNNRKYSVSAVTVLDNACLTTHKASAPSSIIGQRYIALANQTKGILGSICSNFADELMLIQNKILELSTQFQLARVPILSTLSVVVNGSVVPQDATNGWTYDSSANTIVFHGTAIPQQGAEISVSFDPVGVKI